MSPTDRRSLGVGLALLGALLGCSADPPERPVVTRSSVSDASGDVLVGGHSTDPEAVAAAPDNAITDIVRTTVDHRADDVTVTAEFRDLRPRQSLDLTTYVTTDRTGSRLPAQATALAYRGETSVDLYDASGSPCAGAAVDVDFDTNTVTMTLPRSCLGEPQWIEAETTAATMRYDAQPDDPYGEAVWEDHAYGTGRAGWDAAVPRLHHP
jgi:hypothetical protein